MLIATMLSGNSAAIVEGAVQGVLEFVDRLLLIDTGITDETTDKLRELAGEKLTTASFPWCNDFAQARNFSLQESARLGGTWAMTLDTDERMLLASYPTGVALLEKLNTRPEVKAWLVPHVSGYYAKERFIRLPCAQSWQGRTHEGLGGFAAHERQVLPGALFDELVKSPAELAHKLSRDQKILEAETRDHPQVARWWYFLGQTLEDQAQHEAAIAAYRQCIDRNDWIEETAWACFRAAWCHMQLKQFAAAIKFCAEGLGHQPGSPELAWLAGYCCFQLQKYQDCITWAKLAIAIGNFEGCQAGNHRIGLRHAYAWYEGPYDLLNCSYVQLGNSAAAQSADQRSKAAAELNKVSAKSSLGNMQSGGL